ncbi:DUF5131 family protein [Actinomadura gamaensis]|uniref:DUF5131 family protein n=1 Tax=Actinomadura gamaensis TaxID=1763541 RepID=A0ABV9U360_9ACTN
MSDHSSIEWTDATWNPVTGCTKVSPGCTNCYAATFAERFRDVPGHHFEHGFDLTLRPAKLTQPLHWRRGRRIFVNSMSDLFHTGVPADYIARVFAVMAASPRHTFQVLTKRHARMRTLLNLPDFAHTVRALAATDYGAAGTTAWAWPLPNVWLGVSVENQKWADIRVPALLNTSAAVRFLSAEPLLGPIDLTQAVRTMGSERGHGLTASFVHAGGCCQRRFHGIDWVIAGGESGPAARPAHPDWFRSLRAQCDGAQVPFFFKQWGMFAPASEDQPHGPIVLVDQRGRTHSPRVGVFAPADAVRMKRLTKHRAGRVLDGRTHDAFPAPLTVRPGLSQGASS